MKEIKQFKQTAKGVANKVFSALHTVCLCQIRTPRTMTFEECFVIQMKLISFYHVSMCGHDLMSFVYS